MSLDVYLTSATATEGGSGIFIREDGQTREVTRAEWDERFPNGVPVIVKANEESNMVYRSNITHNLSSMAEAAGLYEALWRPEEVGITRADQLIRPLATGLNYLLSDPQRFKTYNPANGWGDYDGLVTFVREYLEACRQHPAATVSAYR